MSDIARRLRNVHRDWDPRLTILLDAADEIERLRAVLESLTKDPPATLDEPDEDWEVITKMRVIAAVAAWRNEDQADAITLSRHEIIVLLEAAVAERERCARLEQLIQTLLDNDPNDLAADGGVTVMDVWRKEAAAAIRKGEK